MRYTLNEKKRLQAWANWLSGYDWAWFCHLTCEEEIFNGKVVPVSRPRAVTLFNRFAEGIGLGTPYFWVMEQKAGNVNWQEVNSLVRPGVLRMFTYQLLSRGANAVLFFRWRQPR